MSRKHVFCWCMMRPSYDSRAVCIPAVLYLQATEEKAKVEAEAAACLTRLSLAERLVGGLSSENERWGNEIEKLRNSANTLVGDCMLASGFVSYVGAFDQANRDVLWKTVWTPGETRVDRRQMFTSKSWGALSSVCTLYTSPLSTCHHREVHFVLTGEILNNYRNASPASDRSKQTQQSRRGGGGVEERGNLVSAHPFCPPPQSGNYSP